MDSSIIIALVGALINIMLSVIVPCVFKRSDNSMMNDMREVYKTNRQMIFSSSMIIGITIYLALEFTPQLKEAIGNLVELSEPQLSNLARL